MATTLQQLPQRPSRSHQQRPPLTFPIASQTYGAAPFTVSASSASSGAITYSYISGPATLSGSTVTITGVGTVTLQASQAANGNYGAATATTNFTVTPATPTLAFPIASQTYGAAPFTVSATSPSSGAITYSFISGPASLSGSTVTLTGVGTVTLQASQAANGNYAAATVTTTFTVTPATPTLAFPIASQIYGAAPFTVSASSASSGAITYSYISGPATLSGSTVTITGVGTVTLQASQAANGNYGAATATTSFAVTPLTTTLVFTTIPSKTYGVAPFTVSATSASSGAITYSVVSGPATISGSTVTITGVGSVTLQAEPGSEWQLRCRNRHNDLRGHTSNSHPGIHPDRITDLRCSPLHRIRDLPSQWRDHLLVHQWPGYSLRLDRNYHRRRHRDPASKPGSEWQLLFSKCHNDLRGHAGNSGPDLPDRIADFRCSTLHRVCNLGIEWRDHLLLH